MEFWLGCLKSNRFRCQQKLLMSITMIHRIFSFRNKKTGENKWIFKYLYVRAIFLRILWLQMFTTLSTCLSIPIFRVPCRGLLLLKLNVLLVHELLEAMDFFSLFYYLLTVSIYTIDINTKIYLVYWSQLLGEPWPLSDTTQMHTYCIHFIVYKILRRHSFSIK